MSRPLSKQILWVENDQDNREVVALFLHLSGYIVTSVINAAEAVGLAQSRRFDLYLPGDWLPHGKESRLCAQLHQFAQRCPILFFSAGAYPADRQRAMEAGALEYLTKPSDFDRLAESVTRLLNGAPCGIQEAG
jgi:two-component system response regulator PilR (NtrC family)